MIPITIYREEDDPPYKGLYIVKQGDKYTDELSVDEALSLVVELLQKEKNIL